MLLALLSLALFFLSLNLSLISSELLALSSAHSVARSSDLLLQLTIFDRSSPNSEISCSQPDCAVYILSLPSSGSISQVSSNFLVYGSSYSPAKGQLLGRNITDASNVQNSVNFTANRVIDPALHIVYTAPANAAPTSFTFLLIDSLNSINSTGKVDLTVGNNVAVSENFYFPSDSSSWQVEEISTDNRIVLNSVSYSPTSTGILNHYIYYAPSSNFLANPSNSEQRWSFVKQYNSANFINSYSGTLSFVLGSFAGNFADSNQYNQPFSLVELLCNSCNNGAGITIAQRNIAWNGLINAFAFDLTTQGGWLINPNDNRVANWPIAASCEIVNVLKALSTVKIYADYTIGYEAVGLDGITFTTGAQGIPTECL
jgi:hypothetical protein